MVVIRVRSEVNHFSPLYSLLGSGDSGGCRGGGGGGGGGYRTRVGVSACAF